MKIIAIIMEPVEIDKILSHLKKIGRAPLAAYPSSELANDQGPVKVNLN